MNIFDRLNNSNTAKVVLVLLFIIFLIIVGAAPLLPILAAGCIIAWVIIPLLMLLVWKIILAILDPSLKAEGYIRLDEIPNMGSEEIEILFSKYGLEVKRK